MDNLSILVNNFQIFLLIFVRISSFIFVCPVLSSSLIPARGKIIFALLLSYIIYPSISFHDFTSAVTLFQIILMISHEVFVGMILGFIGTIIFEAIRVAGEVAGMQSGFGIVSVMDPQNQQQLSIISIFLYLIATILFVVSGGLNYLIAIIYKSFKIIHIGNTNIIPVLSLHIASFFDSMINEAIKLILPITTIVLTINIVMGILSRAVPRIQVFLMAFPLNLLFSMLIMVLVMPVYFEMMDNLFSTLYKSFDFFYQFLGA